MVIERDVGGSFECELKNEHIMCLGILKAKLLPFIVIIYFLSPHTWFDNKQILLANTYVDNKFTESTYTYLKLLSCSASFPALELNFANCIRCVGLVTNFGPTWLIWEAAMLMSDAGSMVEELDPIPSPLNSP